MLKNERDILVDTFKEKNLHSKNIEKFNKRRRKLSFYK